MRLLRISTVAGWHPWRGGDEAAGVNDELLAAARDAAVAGAAVLRRHFRSTTLDVRSKGSQGLVSEADHRSEEAIVSLLRRRFPDHAILSEEVGQLAASKGSAVEWIIDPLDGTTNFVRGLPLYAVAIACRVRGRLEVGVVHDPEGDNQFWGSRGGGSWWNSRRMAVSSRPTLQGAFLATGFPLRSRGVLDLSLPVYREAFAQARAMRRIGAAALDLAYTAAGVYDGFFEIGLSPWDVAAGALLVAEAGGVVTDLAGGDRYLETGHVLAAGSALHQELCELAQAGGGSREVAQVVS